MRACSTTHREASGFPIFNSHLPSPTSCLQPSSALLVSFLPKLQQLLLLLPFSQPPFSSSSPNVGQRRLRLRSDQRRLRVNVVFASTSTTCFVQIASAVSRPLFFFCSFEITSASLFRSPQPRPFLKSSSSYLLNPIFSSSAPCRLFGLRYFSFSSSSFSCKALLPSRTPNRSSFHGIKIQLSLSSPPLRIHRRNLAVVMVAKRKEEMEQIGSKSTEDINEEIIDLKGELFML
ncbi:hypothetical protein ACLOJK_010814 [Asimina triloba]